MQRKPAAHTNLQGELKAFSYPSPLPAPLLHKYSHFQSRASATDIMLPHYHYCVHNFTHHKVLSHMEKMFITFSGERANSLFLISLMRNPYTSIYIPYTQYIYIIHIYVCICICHIHQYIQYTYTSTYVCIYIYTSICVCVCINTQIVNKDGFLFYNSVLILSYCILNKKHRQKLS